jgi:predicted Fe-S protein YdhL (DUF1289 family)
MQTPPTRGISAQPASPRHSPCVGVCQLDDTTGWCRGCGRSGDEVALWLGLSEEERLAVWGYLPQRLDRLGVGVRLLPWTRPEIASWVQETLRSGSGIWSAGASGASAEFHAGKEHSPEIFADDDRIEARLPQSQFRLKMHDKLRAFGFGSADDAVVLGLPKARATLSCVSTLTALGEDVDAIDPQHRSHMLFDLGIGQRSSRFCVRTDDNELIATLSSLIGRPGARVLQEAGARLLASSPHCVVESAQARVEILKSGGDGQSSAAALSLLALLEGNETQSSAILPEFALPVAIYAPRNAG